MSKANRELIWWRCRWLGWKSVLLVALCIAILSIWINERPDYFESNLDGAFPVGTPADEILEYLQERDFRFDYLKCNCVEGVPLAQRFKSLIDDDYGFPLLNSTVVSWEDFESCFGNECRVLVAYKNDECSGLFHHNLKYIWLIKEGKVFRVEQEHYNWIWYCK